MMESSEWCLFKATVKSRAIVRLLRRMNDTAVSAFGKRSPGRALKDRLPKQYSIYVTNPKVMFGILMVLCYVFRRSV